MDIKEFSSKLADATKNMTEAEREVLMRVFSRVSEEITKVEGDLAIKSTMKATGLECLRNDRKIEKIEREFLKTGLDNNYT